MKIYISADIEGVCGSTHWDECDSNKSDWNEFKKQMTAEVAATCKGAKAAGAKEIIVQDAHASARNITGKDLPGWCTINPRLEWKPTCNGART